MENESNRPVVIIGTSSPPLLEVAVRKRAGFNPERLWVTWDSEHKGVKNLRGKRISSNRFPVYGIPEDWVQGDLEALVTRYIDWISPSLLTIPYLDKSSRARLESRLEKQACSIEYHWRLYPEIPDEKKSRLLGYRPGCKHQRTPCDEQQR